MKKLYFLFVMTLMTFAMQAQITGTVVDADSNEPLIGASVLVKGTSMGTITDVDGSFSINSENSDDCSLEVGYLGYQTIIIKVAGCNGDVGAISVVQGYAGLEEVVISGVMDIVQSRRTPVAVSTILAAEIQAKSSGNVELTEIAKATPSVYIANQSGGYGDSEVFTRGFDQTNTAFLLNGQPINGMEDGKMYWSNWSGLTDVASAIQIQRGLGASKLAISSVGGTWNFVMKATELEKGGGLSLQTGNNNYQKQTAFYNTGMVDDKWGVSVLLSNWSGDGWANGTRGQGQTYFVSAGFKLSEKHKLNFLLTGAPQWHDQNFNKSISSHIGNDGELNPRYNSNWGIYNGDYFTERRNYYHKPVANLNYEFDINDKSKFSAVFYASWGRGGGTGGLGSGRVRTESGLIDFDATAAAKQDTSQDVTYIRRASVNNHSWYGTVLNYERDLTSNLKFSIGGDLRSYTGDHYRQVQNLLGSESYAQGGSPRYPNGINASTEYSTNPWSALTDNAPEGDRIAYNNGETINYGGIFSQLEYSNDQLSAYFQGAISNQTHVRFEKYYASEADEESENISNSGYNLKAGLSYNVSSNSSAYVNVGLYSRQPFHDVVFIGNSNDVNIAAENEQILGLEAGYKYESRNFGANLNLYRTAWGNRINTQYFRDGDIVPLNGVDNVVVNDGYTNTKQDQLHQGIELDFSYFATDDFTLKGFGSVGNWEVDGDAVVQLFGDNRNLIDTETLSGENSIDGTKIGGSAQTSMGLGAKYNFTENFYSELNYIHYSSLYARVSSGELLLPSFGVADLNIGYVVPMKNGNVLRFGANIYNLLSTLYISQANSANEASANEAENWNGVNMSNRVRFGKTRTWNVSMKYQF